MVGGSCGKFSEPGTVDGCSVIEHSALGGLFGGVHGISE